VISSDFAVTAAIGHHDKLSSLLPKRASISDQCASQKEMRAKIDAAVST
jgi:hypothetical protein